MRERTLSTTWGKTRIEALSDGVFAIASFLITFALAGSYWFMHHATFHSIRSITRPVAMLNLPFLMFVSLLPFSTGLLSKLGLGHPVALAVYFSNQLALGLCLNVVWLVARRRGLIETPLPDPAIRFMIGAQPVSCVAALAAIAVNPMGSYWAYLIVTIVARRIAQRKFKPLPADAPAPL